tara:strand:+ start:745 stop:1161 length:417 start_codon:yes stop_codon:yes gene_type:complete
MGLFVFREKTMQILHNIPEVKELSLPTVTAVNVLELLIEPFGTLDKAHQFWHEYPCILICISKRDTLSTEVDSLSDELQDLIGLAETEPEFVEFLSGGYQLSLTIINDEGNGLYLVKPDNLTHRRTNDNSSGRQLGSN